MISLRSVLALALVVLACGCSAEESGTPQQSSATTVKLTLDGRPVDLTGTKIKCYDFEGHLSVEASGADREATRFLMDYYNNGMSLSIKIKNADPDLYDYEQGRNGQNATVTRNAATVSANGVIGVALDDTTPPKKFTINANCGTFFNTPPDSSG